MSGFATVCFLGTAIFLLAIQLSLPRSGDDFEEMEEFDESSNPWLSMIRRLVILTLAVIIVPLAVIILQQRSILYRPEVSGRRVSTGPKCNPASFGLQHEGFFISSRDGTKLHAWLLYLQKDVDTKRPAVLFFHSNAGDIPQRLDFFSRLCRQLNVVILAVEYRGFGRSDDAGISEEAFVEDAASSYEWMVNYAAMENSGVDPERLFVFGRSLGGCVTVRLLTHLLGADAALKSPPEAGALSGQRLPLPAGILIENSPSCIAEMAIHLMPFLRVVPRKFLSWPILLDEWRSNDWLDWIGSTLSSEKKSLGVCLLSAAHDKVVPASCMEELRTVGGKHDSLEISFHSFQRGEHMSTYLLAGERYWQALKGFICR